MEYQWNISVFLFFPKGIVFFLAGWLNLSNSKDILIDGEALNDLDAIVSKILPTFRANVQAGRTRPNIPLAMSFLRIRFTL